MLALGRGDDDAFRSIVEHYGRRVHSLFHRAGADMDSADDLTQEVFLRIYRARERYEPRAKFSTWLHRIVHRIAINEGTRNRWRRAVRFQTETVGERTGRGLSEPIETNETDPLAQLTNHELNAQVREAVQSLPDSQRTALLMNRFQNSGRSVVPARWASRSVAEDAAKPARLGPRRPGCQSARGIHAGGLLTTSISSPTRENRIVVTKRRR